VYKHRQNGIERKNKMDNYQIMSGESVKDYKIRLCKNKSEYGLSWEEIADRLNALSTEPHSESTYRKWWKAYSSGLKDAETTPPGVPIASDLRLLELEKARMKFYDQRREYKKLVRASARDENLYDLVKESLQKIEPIKFNPKDADVFLSDNDLFVGLNDLHYGAYIDNHWNKYSPEIAKERMSKYLNHILAIKDMHYSENCYVCANGDLISGKIHSTIEISNCENVVEQVMGVSELVSSFLASLCENFKNVYFCVVAGNHSRLGKKDESPKGERLDDLIPWYVECRLQNINNFKILNNAIDSTVNMVNIRGLNYLNVHGDYDGFSTIQRLTSMITEDVYCIHFGHKHHNYTDWNQKYKIVMSGSLQGMDDYCIEKRIFGRAQQLVGVCTKDGMICTYDVDLQ
jgi:hypothetical protein